MGYLGSEDSIRSQFEEYILSLLSSMAYQTYHESLIINDIPASVANIPESFPDPGDNAGDFNPEFLAIWRSTYNFELFNRLTDGNRIFDIIEPRHPTGGGLGVEDLQRRLAQGISVLHLDDRVREGREVVGRTLASGRERVEAGLRGVWAEVERARAQRQAKRRSRSGSRSFIGGRGSGEAERKENNDPTSPKTSTLSNASSNSSWMVVEGDTPASTGIPSEKPSTSSPEQSVSSPGAASKQAPGAWSTALRDRAAQVDTTQIQASAREGAAKAGAYLNSWGTWAKGRIAQNQVGKAGEASTADDRSGGGGRLDHHEGGMEANRR